MKHFSHFALVAISVLLTSALMTTTATAQPQRPERPREAVTSPTVGISQIGTPPVVKVWTDKGDDKNGNTPIYYVGERIYISFQVEAQQASRLYLELHWDDLDRDYIS